VSVDRDTRNARIDARLEARLQEGMVEEVKRLLDSCIPAEDLIYYGLEYKFLTQYLIGELSYEEMVSGLRTAIHQFAKRQMTWFRGMERKGVEMHWVER
jgi:tRNA dimethylallyltransferase